MMAVMMSRGSTRRRSACECLCLHPVRSRFWCVRLTERSFCGQDEEHDPGEEYEEILACAVCGDNGE